MHVPGISIVTAEPLVVTVQTPVVWLMNDTERLAPEEEADTEKVVRLYSLSEGANALNVIDWLALAIVNERSTLVAAL